MEIKSKVGNAAITGAFWAIGYEQELDVFEQMGNPKKTDGTIHENSTRMAVHDWSPPATRPTMLLDMMRKICPTACLLMNFIFMVQNGVRII